MAGNPPLTGMAPGDYHFLTEIVVDAAARLYESGQLPDDAVDVSIVIGFEEGAGKAAETVDRLILKEMETGVPMIFGEN